MQMEMAENHLSARVIDLELPHELLPWQQDVEDNWHRFNVISAARRSGKSEFGVNRCVIEAGTVPGSLSWHVAPTYTMAKDIAWAILKVYLRDFIKHNLIRKMNESELYVETIFGSIIALKGSDKPDSLRGTGLNLLVLDEYAIMKRAVWEEVLRPSVSDKRGDVLFISTPKGYNHFYEVYEEEKKNPDEWRSWHVKATEAGILSVEEIASAKRDMDDRAFRQEYEASFETFGGQVFPMFDRHVHAGKLTKFNNDLDYENGMDFGWASPMAVLFIQIDVEDNVFVFDELGARETPITVIGDKIRAKKYTRKRDDGKRTLLDPDWINCDAAGDAKNEASGTSPVMELRQMGFKVRFKKKYPGIIQDRINLIRKWLNNKKLWIDSENCPNLVKAMEMYRYPDPKDNIQSELPLKDGISDHWIDALGEFFINRFPVKKSEWGVL